MSETRDYRLKQRQAIKGKEREAIEVDPLGDIKDAYYYFNGKHWAGSDKGLSLWASEMRLKANTFGNFKEGDREFLDKISLTQRNSGNITSTELGSEVFGNEMHMDDLKNFIAEEAFPAVGAVGGHLLGKPYRMVKTGLGALTGEGVRSTATDANKGGELDKGGIVSNAITSGVEYSIFDALMEKLGKTKAGKAVGKYAKPVLKGSARKVPVLSALWPGELGGGLDEDGISLDMVNPNRGDSLLDWDKFQGDQ